MSLFSVTAGLCGLTIGLLCTQCKLAPPLHIHKSSLDFPFSKGWLVYGDSLLDLCAHSASQFHCYTYTVVLPSPISPPPAFIYWDTQSEPEDDNLGFFPQKIIFAMVSTTCKRWILFDYSWVAQMHPASCQTSVMLIPVCFTVQYTHSYKCKYECLWVLPTEYIFLLEMKQC